VASDTEFSLWNNVITAVTAVGATGTAPVGAIDLYATLLELAGGVSQSSESKSFVDCFANPTTCTPRAVASSIIFSESHVPVPMYDTQVFENYGIYLTTVEAGNLYGLRRDFDDNTDPTNSDNWADILYDLGSSTVIDEAKRYDQSEITSPDANAIIARDRMTTEITRLIAARWATHANSMIGVTMTGVSTR